MLSLHTYTTSLYFPSFLVYNFKQYTRVTKIAKATRDMNKNMDTVVVV